MKNFFEPDDPATKAFFVEMKADETMAMYGDWVNELYERYFQGEDVLSDLTNMHAAVDGEGFQWDVNVQRVIDS